MTTQSADAGTGELRIGTYGLGPLVSDAFVQPFVFNGLMRLDANLSPVPDLATACDVGPDGLAVTCRLTDATFHDGSPVSAADVIFSFDLLAAKCRVLTCPFAIGSMEAVDTKTVLFHLTQPDGSFLGQSLLNAILPKHVVEVQFQEWMAATPAVDSDKATALAEGLEEESLKARPDCEGSLEAAATFARSANMSIEDHGAFVNDAGGFDACAASSDLANALRDLVTSRSAKGTAAIGAALSFLAFRFHPIGSGPWEVSSYTRGVLGMTSNRAFFRGAPQISKVRIQPYGFRPDLLAADVQQGHLDWAPLYATDTATIGRFQRIPANPLDYFRRLKADARVQVAEYPALTFTLIRYNTRPGMLLADSRLRKAIALCADRGQLVDAATSGTAVPVSSAVPPASWAYLAAKESVRNVEAGRALIEEAGWSAGPDGVYVKGGRRLAFELMVREDVAQRVKFVDLLTLQLHDCGMDAHTHPVQHSGMNDVLAQFPHLIPGTAVPFDAIFLGYLSSSEPDFGDVDARQITAAEPPKDPAFYGANFGGYTNASVQDLIEQAQRTPDLKARARIYRDIQALLPDDPPAFYVWAPAQHDLVSARLTGAGTPLQLTSPNWAWDPADFVLAG